MENSRRAFVLSLFLLLVLVGCGVVFVQQLAGVDFGMTNTLNNVEKGVTRTNVAFTGLVETAESFSTHEVKIPSGSERATVLRAVDGDTLEVTLNTDASNNGTWTNAPKEKIRLIGIDTPETVDPRKPVQCFGKEAKAKTTELLVGQQVFLASDLKNSDRDKYGRLLRYIYLADGTLVNAQLVQEGYAFAYITYPFEHLEQFRKLEKQAREGEKGLWNKSVCSY